MKLHLIGGFLGSGKTTAITTASKVLKDRGTLAGVITNDQGNYLVDSSFAKANEIPTEEVTGGCFCCNYNDLDEQIDSLIKAKQPKHIFAESVGSCTDLVATVLKPMLKNKKEAIEAISFSVFVDSKLLLTFLEGKETGFTDEVSYIFEKQLEEASILIVNKIDLLSETELKKITQLVDNTFPEKSILYQNSLNLNSIEKWISAIDNKEQATQLESLEIDYDKYGKGEADLAWLDEEVEILAENSFNIAVEFIDKVYEALQKQDISIGHLKFLLNNGKQSQKVSFTAIPVANWKNHLNELTGSKINMMVNARAQTSPENLRNIVISVIDELKRKTGAKINEYCVSAFKPGFPNPTFRYAS